LPASVLAAPTPPPEEAHRELLARSARSLGVATVRDLADYFRIAVPLARPRIAELVEARRLIAVTVEGWREPAYLHPEAAPRAVAARPRLSQLGATPADHRPPERPSGSSYRPEISPPAHRRKHGYYVLPFLLGDALVARVDVKADRAAGALLVHAAYA